ncbi:MAG: hypothetical protein ACYC5G_01240 [Candidatus Doudnabacteria bacterium]
MLFKNHKKVVLEDEPLYQAVKSELNSFLKGKKYVTFTASDKVIINATGAPEPERTYTIPVEVICPNKEGDDNDTWIYCKTAPKTIQNGEKEYDRLPMIVGRDIVVQTTEKDKIFFLMYLSPAVKNGRFILVDEEKEARESVAKLARATRIDFMLTGGEYSPVDETTIRRVAKAFGVGNVDGKQFEKVVIELRGIIAVAEANHDKQRNNDAFLQAINVDEAVNTRAILQEAIDEGRVIYEEEKGVYSYAGEDGVAVKKIMNVDPLIQGDKIKRMNALANLFITNADKRKELINLQNYTVEDVDFYKYSYGSLKQFAAKNGISGQGKADELIPRIIEQYELLKETKKFDFSCLVVSEKKTE